MRLVVNRGSTGEERPTTYHARDVIHKFGEAKAILTQCQSNFSSLTSSSEVAPWKASLIRAIVIFFSSDVKNLAWDGV